MSKSKKIHKNIYLLGWVSLFTDLSSQMIYPLIPGYLVSLGATPAIIGWVEGISESVASLFKTLFGKMSDRMDRRKGFVMSGYSLSAISKPLLALTASWLPVLGLRVADRLGKAIRNPARDAMVSLSADQEVRGKSFGIQRGMDRVGAAGGAILASAVLWLSNDSIKTVFLLAGIPALLALIFIPFTRELVREEKKTENKEVQGMDRSYRILLISMIIFTLGNSSNAFLILKASESGIELIMIPILWLLYNVVAAVSSPILGQLSDRIDRKTLIHASFIIYGLIYLGFAFAGSPLWIWLLFGVYGIYYGLSDGVFKAYIADHVAGTSRGLGYGLFQTGTGLALLPASLIMGYVWDLHGSKMAFLISVIFSILGYIIFLIYEKR